MVYNETGCGLKRGSLLPTLWACEGQKDLSEGASIPLRGHWFCVRARRCRRLAAGCVCVFFAFLDECVSTNFKMILPQNQFQNDEVVWDPHFGLSTAQQNRRSLHWSRYKDTGFVYKRHDIKDYPPVVCACFLFFGRVCIYQLKIDSTSELIPKWNW